MHLTVTLDLPADPSTATRMLADPSFVHAKVRATGALGPNLNMTHPTPFQNGQLTQSQLADLAAYVNR